MSLIPRAFINELLTRCDIVELIDARVSLKKKGNNYSACCPFHNEKTPSFTVSQNKQFYHCFGCGANGNILSFLMNYDRLTFVEAIEYLAAQQGMTVPRADGQLIPLKHPDLYQLMEQVAVFYQRQLREYPTAIDYLKQRGLTGESAREFRIGYARSAWDGLVKHFATTKGVLPQLVTAGLIIKKTEGGYYDRFRDRIMFPIRDQRGRIIGFGGRVLANEEPKYLNSPETPVFHKGRELYGLFEACQATRNLPCLFVVEGYMDVIALAQFGIRQAVATLGTATTADHIQRLARMTQEIIFCFDGDKAGQTAAWRALETTLPLMQDGWQVRFLFLPGGEDPDSLVRKEGAQQFMARLQQASSLADFLFTTLSQGLELASAEGRARLTKLAMPLLNKLPLGVFQHMLFERLANLVRMDVHALKNLTQGQHKDMAAAPAATAKKSHNPRRSPMRLALALLLQYPNLVQSLPSAYTGLAIPGGKLLSELITLLKQTPDLTTAILVEYWRERPEYSLLVQLAGAELNIPVGGVESEFLGVIVRLQQMYREKIIEQLLQKASQNSLSEEDKRTLQQLIAVDKV